MNLQKWVNEGRLHQHQTNKQEIRNLFALVERDINDARVTQLSTDRRFATAYNAALQLATVVLHASGYRVKASIGHHWVTFLVLPEIMGKQQKGNADYFNACRAKRNVMDYDRVGAISDAALVELLQEVIVFKHDVEIWIGRNYPHLI